jgi:pimeloyl-ACP methyl ester carboxylesterase
MSRSRPAVAGRRVTVVAGVAAVLLIAAVVVRTVWQTLGYVQPPRLPVEEADRARARALLPGLGDLELRTSDGLRLSGWFSPGAAHSAVILVHGFASNRTQLLPEAAVLARHGHGVMLFDLRAHGQSEGRICTWGDREALDVLAALDFLRARPEVDPSRIGLYGFSIGSNAVARVAAADPAIPAVAMGPLWPSLHEELNSKFPRLHGRSPWLAEWIFRWEGADIQAIDPLDQVPHIAPRPVLLLSGSEDRDTPPEMTALVAAHAPAAEVWVVRGARHGGYAVAAPEEFDRRVGGFFDRALLASSRRP